MLKLAILVILLHGAGRLPAAAEEAEPDSSRLERPTFSMVPT